MDRSLVAVLNKYLHVVFGVDEYRDFYAIQNGHLFSHFLSLSLSLSVFLSFIIEQFPLLIYLFVSEN
jgi:hypothetical protein